MLLVIRNERGCGTHNLIWIDLHVPSFQDIDDKDLADGKLHLVCYLVRVGQMHADKATKGQKVRRPYACAAMKLTTARILDEASRGVLKLK